MGPTRRRMFTSTPAHPSRSADRRATPASPAARMASTPMARIARQSGSALSGKDPSRIERAGAYAARHAAKNIVAAGLAERCEVHLAYAVGQAQPLSLSVETFGSGQLSDDAIAKRLSAVLDFRPASIVQRFGLRTAPRRRPGRLLSAARDLWTFRARRSRPALGGDRRRRGA